MKILLTIVILWGILLSFLFYKSGEQYGEFNQWALRCIEDGGVVSQTAIGFVSTSFECIKDGKIINHVD